MQIITVELLDDRALALLKQLEQLHILRFVSSGKVVSNPYDFSDLAGKLKWKGNAVKEQRLIRDEW